MLVVLLLIAVLDCCGGGAMEVGDAQPAPAPAPAPTPAVALAPASAPAPAPTPPTRFVFGGPLVPAPPRFVFGGPLAPAPAPALVARVQQQQYKQQQYKQQQELQAEVVRLRQCLRKQQHEQHRQSDEPLGMGKRHKGHFAKAHPCSMEHLAEDIVFGDIDDAMAAFEQLADYGEIASSYAEMVAERAFGLGNEEQDPMLICSASAVLCGMGELGVVYLQAGMEQVASLLKHEDHNVVRVACHGLRTLGKRAQPVAGAVKALLKNPKTMALAIDTLEPILGQGQEFQRAKAVMIGACGRYLAQMSITNEVCACLV